MVVNGQRIESIVRKTENRRETWPAVWRKAPGEPRENRPLVLPGLFLSAESVRSVDQSSAACVCATAERKYRAARFGLP